MHRALARRGTDVPHGGRIVTTPDTGAPFFAMEREQWIGNGLDTARECVDAQYEVYSYRDAAERAARAWQARGWVTTVTGPHYPVTSYPDANW